MKKEQWVGDKIVENITILGRRERRSSQRSQKNGQKNRDSREYGIMEKKGVMHGNKLGTPNASQVFNR